MGTFTRDGTFEAAIGQLDRLRDLGVTAVELMPVAQFSGHAELGLRRRLSVRRAGKLRRRRGLQRFVDACHARGLAVVLDVVYNHLGPEGNYLRDFGPYFTDQYRTPWGDALNFDGPGSDQVRAFFLANALMWQTDFHIDALEARCGSRHQGRLGLSVSRRAGRRHAASEPVSWVGVSI